MVGGLGLAEAGGLIGGAVERIVIRPVQTSGLLATGCRAWQPKSSVHAQGGAEVAVDVADDALDGDQLKPPKRRPKAEAD